MHGTNMKIIIYSVWRRIWWWRSPSKW